MNLSEAQRLITEAYVKINVFPTVRQSLAKSHDELELQKISRMPIEGEIITLLWHANS